MLNWFIVLFKVYYILLFCLFILLMFESLILRLHVKILIYLLKIIIVIYQFSRSVVLHSLRPRGPQHARPPCPSPTPRAYPNPCPSSQWCHPATSSSVVPFSSCLQSFPASGFFQMKKTLMALCMRWPKFWSFSLNVSPSSEHSGLISFRMDWLDSQESSTPQFKSINSLVLSFLHSPILTSIHDHWKNHSLD